ncbi:MAG: hypothetical protein ACI4F1_01690 [Bariatricus sp.]
MNEETKKIQNDNSDIFNNSFEVTCEDVFPDLPSDLGNDAYKDVLSKLSELDDEESIDYLEVNKTRTLPFSKTVQDYMKPDSKTADSSQAPESNSAGKQPLGKEGLYAVVFILVLAVLAALAYTIR